VEQQSNTSKNLVSILGEALGAKPGHDFNTSNASEEQDQNSEELRGYFICDDPNIFRESIGDQMHVIAMLLSLYRQHL
jgi:hypothetical protein